MSPLINILLAVLVVSLVSFAGALILFFHIRKTDRLMFPLVSFAAGAMLAAAFFDLIPEALAAAKENAFLWMLGGILLFFLVEKLLYWYHCHQGECTGHHSHGSGTVKPAGLLNLVGDAVHNSLDGAVIAAAFLASPGLGLVTTLAVIFHEIPQEIGDFSILVYSGFSQGKALFFNFLSALTAFIGALLAFFAANAFEAAKPILLSVAAGGFIYIALADLIPELHHDQEFPNSLLQLVWLGIGVMIIFIVSTRFGV